MTVKRKNAFDDGGGNNKTVFLKSGSVFKPSAKEDLDIHEKLPVGTYNVVQAPCGYQLSKIDNFEITGKIYGDLTQQSERILSTFSDRTTSTGVLLAGEKGSGKTLLTKHVAIQAAKQGIPTIVINSPYCGESFNSFLQLIEQPAVIIFDEYEKVYSAYGTQEKLLTLLDGVYPSKKLFLLTSNSRWGIDRHMLNRPGRLFYVINFHGLNLEFVKGYATENLIDKKQVEKVCVVAAVFEAFNLDMLKALVQEMNRYGESPGKSLKWLNVSPEFSSDCKYTIEWTGVDDNIVQLESKEWEGNPLQNGVTLASSENKITVDASNFSRLDIDTKSFIFTKDGNRLVVTPYKKVDFDWDILGVANDQEGGEEKKMEE